MDPQPSDSSPAMGGLCAGGQPKGAAFSLEGDRKDGALLGGADAARFPSVNIPDACGQATPKFTGGFDAFVDATPAIKPQAFNTIKKCPNCGKPNAVTMNTCNACAADLSEVAISFSPNLFIGFIFGVDKASFPLRISVRVETEKMMVFDDPLAITRAHLLAVPTDVYCPDLRSLFVSPEAGLKLLHQMDEAAWTALANGHLASEEWRRKALSDAGVALAPEELRRHVVGAFNLPPSQYQLHLQYMLPPMLPSHLGVFRKGAHFAKFRHFPFSYVVSALEAFIGAGAALPDAPQMNTEDFLKALAERGADYEKAHSEDLAKIAESNALLANFCSDDFKYAIAEGQVYDRESGNAVDGSSAKDVENADKLALQGYGRPYGEDGKPGGRYYTYAREPAALPTLG